MYEGYLSLAGVEVINNQRTAVYARNLGITGINCEPCGIGAALGHPYYELPAVDEDNPWYDPAAPESAGFAGFYALEVVGYGSSPIARSPVERLSDGAVITRSRYNHREVQYTGVLLANGQCSLSYGMAWLSTALRGSTCQPCGGSQACAYTCCPTDEASEQANVRTMAQAAVLAGPTTSRVAKLRNIGCATSGEPPLIAEVTFTLVLGRPWLYRAPIAVVGPTRLSELATTDARGCLGDYTWDVVGQAFATWDDLEAEYASWREINNCVVWNPADEHCPRENAAFDAWGCPRLALHACQEDPQRPADCPEPPAPPQVPRPYDPCGVCYDGPNTMTGSVNIPPDVTPTWLDQVPLVEISTGENAARALLLRFYANPTGQESFCRLSQLDPCTACATMAIPYIPPGSTLTIDGRDFTASLDCDGGRGTAVIDDASGISGPGGRPYTWPVFDCNGFCVSLTVPCDFPVDEVEITVSVVAREDAA